MPESDSWEKIERDIRGNCGCAGGKSCDPPHNGPHCIYQAELDEWADRLRALRERDEKRWEIAAKVVALWDDYLRNDCGHLQYADFVAAMNELRSEAREGRDA